MLAKVRDEEGGGVDALLLAGLAATVGTAALSALAARMTAPDFSGFEPYSDYDDPFAPRPRGQEVWLFAVPALVVALAFAGFSLWSRRD
jgi:hypothetical protein